MNTKLCDLLKNELIGPRTEDHVRSLAEEFKAAGEDGPLWEIYLSLRLHNQALTGDENAAKALSLLRSQLAESQKVPLKPETQKHFGAIFDALPPCWHGVQNETNYMRQIFYPEWMVERETGVEFPVLCLEPHGERWLERLIDRVIKADEDRLVVDADSVKNGDDEDDVFRCREVQDQEFMAGYKAKLASGTGLSKSQQRRFCGSFSGKINAFLVFEKKGRRAGMGGLRACCEKYLGNERLEPYPFTEAAWVSGLSVEAAKPVEVDDEQSRRIAASIADIQSKFERGDYKFSADEENAPDPDDNLAFCLNGIDFALNPVFFRYGVSSRHKNVGGRLFANLAWSLPEPGIVAWPILIAYAVARMDLQEHLEAILRANAREMESLAPWIIIELAQAGRLEEAVALVTGKGAPEALAVGDKGAFDRANCMITALKREREYTYGGIFNYLCARLPELLPEEAARESALKLLEKTALADSFWEDPNLHQEESLIALAGTMLRCGEFDRARSLFQRLFEKHRISKDAEWEKVRSAFLDAACFWYLNGNPDRMIAVLGQYLAMRWCGAGVTNPVVA